MKKNWIFIFFSAFIILFEQANAQNPYQPNISGTNPVTPSAFQFVKYTEMPVSEYTGIPNISVPLYQINVDDIKLPVNLTYHAVGIQVSQEASWVGLGWDLSFGSIVQNINDVDDFFNYGKNSNSPGYHQMIKLQPDYDNNVSYPWEYPFAYQYSMGSIPSVPNSLTPGFFPVISPQSQYGFKVATDSYFPVKGTYLQNATFFTNHQGQYGNFDAEPDIFTANFLGHSLTFMLDWTSPLNYNIVVLNKRGYKVTRNTLTSFQIITPDGDQFFFETENSISSTSSGYGLFGLSYSGLPQPSTNIWLLTRIITKNNKLITINYSSAGSFSNFPSYSEVWQSASLGTTEFYGNAGQTFYGYARGYTGGVTIGGGGFGPTNNGVNPMWAYTTEQKIYPSSISFNTGQINFFTSSTSDILGGTELDSVSIQNLAGQTVKGYKFHYGYFDTLTSPGNGFAYSTSTFGTTASLRLKLLSLTQNDGSAYIFSYDPHPLPKKNSFAQDYWGYYNGQTYNTSLTPNPASFPNYSSWGNNGNNHSAFLSFAKAGILTGIQYPTRGNLSLQYELNQFNNYWVPDSNSSANIISHGNGLRIHSATFSINGVTNTQQLYAYDIGKAIYPVNMFRTYPLPCIAINNSPNNWELIESDYTINEISSHGYYASSPLLSCSGVGYDTVTVMRDSLGLILGKTVTTFENNPALGNNIFQGSSMSVTLPAIKTPGVENGSVNSIFYYDNQNNLLKKIQNTYSTIQSNIYYGSRLFGYSSLVFEPVTIINDYTFYTKPQNLFGFYPIYDIETLPNTTTTTDYGGGNSLITTEGFIYDQYSQLTDHIKYTPAYFVSEAYEHPGSVLTYYTDMASQSMLYNTNRFSDILTYNKFQGPLPYQNDLVYSYYKHYQSVSGVPVESYVTINKNLLAPVQLTDTITYDNYDATFINPLQYTIQKTRNCILWDYKGVYPIANVKNAVISDIAYTSFEADGSGNWNIGSTTRDATKAITGNYSFQLNYGVIINNNVSSSNTYIVSYWSSNGSYSVTGTTAIVTGKTVTMNFTNWTYYEHTVTGVSSVVVSGSGNIDELRLYPKTAQMTTYTYTPLIGMSSQCDVGNRITYYQYDSSSRLTLIKDQDGNIVKKYCYAYYGQPSGCAETYTPPPTGFNMSVIDNNSTYTGYQVVLIPTSGGSTQTFLVNSSGTNSIGPITPGVYNINVYPPSNHPGLMSILSMSGSGSLYSSGSSSSFSNVFVGPANYNTINIY